LKYCPVAICIVINFQICTRFMCMVVVKEIVKAHFKLLWILDVCEKSLYSRHRNCKEHSKFDFKCDCLLCPGLILLERRKPSSLFVLAVSQQNPILKASEFCIRSVEMNTSALK
jgi:hypothetical protein